MEKSAKQTRRMLWVILIGGILSSIIVPISVMYYNDTYREKTLPETLSISIKDNSSEWVLISEQNNFDTIIKHDSIFKKIVGTKFLVSNYIPNTLVVESTYSYLRSELLYNKNCKIVIEFQTYGSAIVLTNKSKVDLNESETKLILASFKDLQENKRLNQQKEILKTLCKD